jgi:hypothetical protein
MPKLSFRNIIKENSHEEDRTSSIADLSRIGFEPDTFKDEDESMMAFKPSNTSKRIQNLNRPVGILFVDYATNAHNYT